MDLVGSSAGVSSSTLTELGSQSGSKKKARIESVYSHGASFKKVKKPVVSSTVVDSSAGLLYADPLLAGGSGRKASWGSKVGNESNNISEVSDLEDMENLVAEETSYIDSNASGNDDLMDDTTPRKMRTKTYVLDKSPKQSSFNLENDDNSVLELPPRTFVGSNQLPPPKSRGLKCHCFEPVKSFALDVELSAVPGKSNSDKLFKIKKIFYKIDGFGGASTPLKFPGVIRSTFTNESSLVKARELAILDLPKLAVETVFSKFGKIISIKVQLIGLWQKALVEYESSEMANLVAARWSVLMGKDSVRMAKANIDKQMWVSRDQHQALLYTLPVGTNAYDLSSLLESYGGKTCYIGRNPSSYVHDRCAVICFGNEASKLAAINTISVFKGVSLHWTGLFLASCTCCKQFGHVTVNCSLGEYSGVRRRRVVSEQDWIHLAGIYKKKSALVACPVSFGGKTWAQVAGGSFSRMISSGLVGTGLHSGLVPSSMVTVFSTVSHLNDQLAILEHSLELLTDCVSGILARLKSIDLVSVATSSLSLLLVVSETLFSDVVSDMILNTALVSSGTPPSVIHDAVVELSSSSSKVLTAKVGGLETKLIALEASVGSVLDKLNILCSGSGLSVPLSSQ
ncbi:hypothetical protein G9A89_013048 [Geosiphon pyriformis]|nr:hypothetical protein G9A89_013048 [Geosiphon pyriformis]